MDVLYNSTEDSWDCNEAAYNDTIPVAKAVSIIRIVSSMLSIIGSSTIIIAVFLTGKLSSSEVHPLFTLAVSDFILSCTWLFGAIVWLLNQSSSASSLGLCYVLAVATLILSIVTYLLTVVYASHAAIKMREIFRNQGRHSLGQSTGWKTPLLSGVMYLCSWVLPVLLVLPVTEEKVGLPQTNNACWCFVDFFNTRPDTGNFGNMSTFTELATIIAAYIATAYLLSTFVIVLLYSYTLFLARKILKMQSAFHADTRSRRSINKLIVRASMFILIYIVCGLPSLVGAFEVLAEKQALSLMETSDKGVLIFQALVAPLQGVLNALVYGWSRKEFRKAIHLPVRVHMTFGQSNAPTAGTTDRQPLHPERNDLLVNHNQC